MASFTDLIAQRIHLRQEEFLAGLSNEPDNEIERLLATAIQAHWHVLEHPLPVSRSMPSVAAVDGSRATRSLSNGADWIIAQALLIGPNGLRKFAADTCLLRGETVRPAVDRYASLLMRSLELGLALKFVQSGAGKVLLLDGSLYADLPHLLYSLAIGGHEDLPLQVLAQYLELFDLCRQSDILLLGVSKSARSAVLGHALLDEIPPAIAQQPDSVQLIAADVQDEDSMSYSNGSYWRHRNVRPGMSGLPTDGELLHRWTKESGITDPVLLGSASFGHTSDQMEAKLGLLAGQWQPQRLPERFSMIKEQLCASPAIGTFYVRVAPGDDVLRVDALADAFGRKDLHLLDSDHTLIPYTTALPIVQQLVADYGGLSVYNAALYVVDQEVRLHAKTVDHIYLSVLRRQLNYPIQYDRSTRRFIQ